MTKTQRYSPSKGLFTKKRNVGKKHLAKKNLRKKHTRKHLKKKQKSSRRSKRGGNPAEMEKAIKNNDIDKVRNLIEEGEDVNQKITLFLVPKSLLTIAILDRKPEIVKLLIEKGANVNETDGSNKTPLFIAIETAESDNIVNILLKNGADVNHKDINGETPLFLAIKNDYSGRITVEEGSASVTGVLIQLLIYYGANVNEKNNKDETPLFIASAMGDDLKVRTLIKNGADVNETNKLGETALYEAAKYLGYDHLNVASSLIKSGAFVDKSNKEGKTPLFSSVINENKDMTMLLLENGANPNHSIKDGVTPLWIAAIEGCLIMVIVLVTFNANVNQADIHGTTPLYIAAQENHFRIAEKLLEYNANVDQSSNDGVTPLMVSANNGNLRIARLLIIYGANINHKDNHNNTPLILATNKDKSKMVKYLIELGANIDSVNKDNLSAKAIAKARGFTEILKYLNNHLTLEAQFKSNTGCQEGIPYSIKFNPDKFGYDRIIIFSAHGRAISDEFYLPNGVQFINLGLVGTKLYFFTKNKDFSTLNNFIWTNQLNLFEAGPSEEFEPRKQPNGSNIPTRSSRCFFRGGEGCYHSSFLFNVTEIDMENPHVITNHYCLNQKCNNYRLTFYDDRFDDQIGWKEISGLKPDNISEDEFSLFNKLDTLHYGETAANATDAAKNKMAFIRETYKNNPHNKIHISDIVEAFEGTNTLLLFHACRTGLDENETEVQRELSEMTPPISLGESKSTPPVQKKERSGFSSLLPDFNWLF